MRNSMKGKIVLVTGATEGVGKAAAAEFARRDATVVVVGRNPQKTANVVADLRAVSSSECIDYLLCDLSKLKDVQRLASEFNAKYASLDVLANNAGAMFARPVCGPDGYELTFSLNHLAPFLLTNLLMDKIRSTPGSRVVTTASAMQARGKIDLETTPYSTTVSGPAAYAASKLANVLFTKALAKRLVGTGSTANCFHPGIVRSNFGAFGTGFGPLMKFVFALSIPFAVAPEKGADSLVWLATSEDGGRLRGEYVSKRQVRTPTKAALDDDFVERFWLLSEQLCEKALSS